MDEQQARDLAARIVSQFPHVSTVVVQSADMRNAPRNWLIGVQRRESLAEGISIHIHNELEWIEAVQALYVLQVPHQAAPLRATFKEHKLQRVRDTLSTPQEHEEDPFRARIMDELGFPKEE